MIAELNDIRAHAETDSKILQVRASSSSWFSVLFFSPDHLVLIKLTENVH
jgi:hypothetical protein